MLRKAPQALRRFRDEAARKRFGAFTDAALDPLGELGGLPGIQREAGQGRAIARTKRR
jgi:hypothetical protein